MSRQLKVAELRFIRLGQRSIEYRFSRTRRRTLGITVDATGVAVNAPLRAPFRDIESFLRDKERWILVKLDEWSRVPRAEPVEVRSGAVLPLAGRRVVLDVRPGGRAVRLEDDRLVICAPGAAPAARALIGWLKTRALDALAPRAAHFAARLGVAPRCVALSAARSQWGVCTEEGEIRLNWRLVHLDPGLADYVVAHEAAHLVELNHSKRFWALVDTLYPAWREAREELELAGASLPLIKEAITEAP